MTFIKICGITNRLDAQFAVEVGADALGFNFYRPSPRYIEISRAREIVKDLPKEILKVGVFVNENEPENVMEIANAVGLDAVQLHGDESPDYCARLKDWYVIKALAVGDEFDPNRALRYKVDAIMLDAKHKELRGGTGQVFDWSKARQVKDEGAKVFLAGGLSPVNVENAIQAVSPYGVDACSALEVEPGRKNQELVREFVEVVRSIK